MTQRPLPPPIQHEQLIAELRHVAEHYPVFPGHALDSRTFRECERRRWIVVQADGGYLPTARGIRTLDAEDRA